MLVAKCCVIFTKAYPLIGGKEKNINDLTIKPKSWLNPNRINNNKTNIKNKD